MPPESFVTFVETNRQLWPPTILEFWESGETERFTTSGDRGDHIDYLVRRDGEVRLYTRPPGEPSNGAVDGSVSRRARTG